jgi:ADP-ribose pyrophosphatase
MPQDKTWKTLKSKELFRTKYIRLREDQCELPDGRIMPNYYVLEFPDWVNVVAITEDEKIVLVNQYRQGGGSAFLEIPGGSMDPGSDESPEEAAARELIEETGYAPEKMIAAGFHFANPALQNNRVHTFVALECKKVSAPTPDPFEDIDVSTPDLKTFWQSLSEQSITHSIILASLFLAEPHLRKLFPEKMK